MKFTPDKEKDDVDIRRNLKDDAKLKKRCCHGRKRKKKLQAQKGEKIKHQKMEN